MLKFVHFDSFPSVEEQLLLHDVVLLIDPTDIRPRVFDNDLPALRRLALASETLLQCPQNQANLSLSVFIVCQQEGGSDPVQVDLAILAESLLTSHCNFF